MVQNIIQIKSDIMVNIGANIKKFYICDEIIDAEAKPFDRKTKSFQVNLSEKNKICETKSFCILLIFLIMDIELLTGVSV